MIEREGKWILFEILKPAPQNQEEEGESKLPRVPFCFSEVIFMGCDQTSKANLCCMPVLFTHLPLAPLAPWSPRKPGQPFSPASPFLPRCPSGPGFPLSPGKPGMPGSPWGPDEIKAWMFKKTFQRQVWFLDLHSQCPPNAHSHLTLSLHRRWAAMISLTPCNDWALPHHRSQV